MKKLIATFKNEDWVIVYAGAIVLLLATLFPEMMPKMPKTLSADGAWQQALIMFASILGLTYICQAVLCRKLKGIFVSLAVIFILSLAAQVVANIPIIKEWGLESVFFSVIFGLIVSNVFGTPEWLKPAIQSEFYIKIGIDCSTQPSTCNLLIEAHYLGQPRHNVHHWNCAHQNERDDVREFLVVALDYTTCGDSGRYSTNRN